MENNNHQKFEIIPALLKELEQETTATRKFLALVPDDQAGWAPHAKSMKMKSLATHLAEIPAWVEMALHTSELDFSKGYAPTEVADNAGLLRLLDDSYQKGRAALAAAAESDLSGRWVMRSGEQIFADLSKYETIRHALAQTIHHRAQLGVYLRQLHIPIPGTYGPSADEMGF